MFGDGQTIADKIRERVKSELGVTVSVGVSYNKIFAKLGSDIKKPDATTVIKRSHFKEIVWPLPVNDLLYVGKSTHKKLLNYKIKTIGDLANSDKHFMQYLLGRNGVMLWNFANGLDTSPVSNIGAKSLIKSIGNSTTAPRDLITDEDIKIILYVLCESVSSRMREYNFICSTVQLGVRDNELHSYERQGKLPYPNRTSKSLFDKAFELYKQHATDKPVRSLSVRACGLSLNEHEQLSFLPEISQIQRQEDLEYTVDIIRSRFGHYSVGRGIMLADKGLSDIKPKDEHIIHPDIFLRK